MDESNSVQSIKQELAADGREAGVEYEEYNPYPFNSEKISITDRRVPMETLLRRFEKKTISAPEIQRGAGIWGDEQQSRLIESLMLKIPVPLFYVAEDEDANWKVVDGLQRVTAIKRYLYDKKFSLVGLEFMHNLEGMKFDDIPLKFQTRILETEFQFAIINPSTPQNVQRNVFKRLNTGGMPLTAQEIRHALYYGPSAELLKDLAHCKIFKKATTNSVDDSRMAGRELVLRFLSFLIRGYKSYPRIEDMDAFLCETMQIINILPVANNSDFEKIFGQDFSKVKVNYGDVDRMKELFALAMDRAHKLFGKYAFRKSLPNYTQGRTPINKSLFETWSVLLSTMSDEKFKLILARRKKLFEALYEVTYDDAKGYFEKCISRDSHKYLGVMGRYKTINKVIESVVSGEEPC